MEDQMEILANNFLDSLKYQCTLNGIKYLFPKTPQVSYPGSGNIKCSGYFDDAPNPIIACALDKPTEDWLEILIHETCHMDQWIENIELWNNIKKDGIDCSVCMDDWLNGKDFTKEEYTHFIRTMQLVEIDCEKRSVDKIIHLDIPIDIEGYIKVDGSNSTTINQDDLDKESIKEIINRCALETIRVYENPQGFQLAQQRIQSEN